MPTYQERVAEATKCPHWQWFRGGLRGSSTKSKLELLQAYLQRKVWFDNNICCSDERRNLQVYNYLTAIARAGLIEVPPDNLYLYGLETGRLVVKRG